MDKWLVFKIYKEFTKLNAQKRNNPVKKWAKDMKDTSPKKTSRWPTGTWKDAQHHSSSGKYKSKPQSHPSEWLKLTTQETIGVGEDVEKGEPYYIVGGNTNGKKISSKS